MVDCSALVLFRGEEHAVSERWLPNTVTILDRFHCICYSNCSILCHMYALSCGNPGPFVCAHCILHQVLMVT